MGQYNGSGPKLPALEFQHTASQPGIGCALTFASEAKFEIEAKISFRLEAKKSLISHDSLQCETPKIWSENEDKISEN